MQTNNSASSENENAANATLDIRRDIVLDAQFDQPYIMMNALAGIIASYALLAGSVSGVIGAMLVAMLLGPIAGLSLSLVDGDYALFKKSSLSLAGGVGIVALCALIIGLIHYDMPISDEMLARTNPNYLDLMIALAGGAVGAYAVVSPRIPNAVVGVAIATALVPPLCTGTIFIARGDWEHAFGAYLLTGTNIIAIQFSSSIVLWLCGFHKVVDRFYINHKVIWLNGITIMLLILLFVTLGTNTKLLVDKVNFETKVRNILIREMNSYPGAYVSETRLALENGKMIIRAVVRSPNSFSSEDVARIESKLPDSPNHLPIELRLRHVTVEVITKNGSVPDAEMSQMSGIGEKSKHLFFTFQ
ncbi:MAG: DUF389 domain-containing protein [Nitrosomonas sp.]|nr:DUF389 domain-containing protein [Nitrosomonas sp.]MBP6075262.1 DUF389 domain-containing protein [Nitrosomonas sp.]